MPMFATLLAGDIRATVSWYTAGLGFIELFTMPGPQGGPALVHLRRWQFQDLLVRQAREPVTPGRGCTLSFAAVCDELDALARRPCAGRRPGRGPGRYALEHHGSHHGRSRRQRRDLHRRPASQAR